jgi:hypothetical protein
MPQNKVQPIQLETSILDANSVGGLDASAINSALAGKTDVGHSHGTLYYTKTEVDVAFGDVPSRNSILTKDVLTSPTSPQAGMSATIYTGDGTASNTIVNGLDMSTGDFGGLVWIKNRDTTDSHILCDTVRGVGNTLSSNSTAIEVADPDTLTTFSTTGFTVGADVKVNTNAEDYVAWSFQTNKKKTGTTNRNKAYTAHYNTDLGFSIVGYEGDGVDGHEIPHHLGVEPELSIYKNRDSVVNWTVQSPFFDTTQYLLMDLTNALAANSGLRTLFTDSTVSVGSNIGVNTSAANHISYNFTSVSGVSKIGKYIGTGTAGNYVNCGFKPAFVMCKILTSAASWVIIDGMRVDNDLYPDSTSAESSTDNIDSTDTGFVIKSTVGHLNTLNNEYLFIAFAETSIDSTKAITNYDKPINEDQLTITNPSLFTFANGFNANGQVDVQEQIAGATLTFGAGHEDKYYYLYRDKDTSFGQTEVRPLIGLTRKDADKYGVVSPLAGLGSPAVDDNSRTTSKHFDYESDSGVVLASGEYTTYYAWQAFNKNSNDIVAATTAQWLIATITNSWLQYKHNEKRILKSWRMRAPQTLNWMPKRFTIEGSIDGYTWVAIDSTYTASDYTGNGDDLWGDLQDTFANTTAYLYHRINITAATGASTYTGIAELEFNTVTEGDYFLVDEAKIYNDSGTRLDRVYYGECKTNSDGDVIWFENYSPSKVTINEIDVHGNLKVYGDIYSWQVITAKGLVDPTVNPPLLLNGKKIADIVDLGTGKFKILFSSKMDSLDYEVFGTLNNSSGVRGIINFYNKTLWSVECSIVYDAAVFANYIFAFHITGGKKIL